MASLSSENHPGPSNDVDDGKLQQMTTADAPPDKEEESKPNWLSASIRNQIKLFDPLLLIMAIKYSLLSIGAMYRSKSVALEIGSLGYLIAIISSLSFAMQPRAKFLQGLFRNILFTCLAVPFTILGLWCARQAKNHTQPPGSNALYNSSAAAISAIFLFFNVYIVNVFRARYPNLMLSVVMYSIQTNVSFTIGYLLPGALPVYYLPKRLLIDFLIAFGLAFGVNILIIPVTSRTRSFTGYLTALSGLLIAHNDFLAPPHNFMSKEREKSLMKAKDIFRGAFIKMAGDKSDAKKEIAYGVLSTDHISELFKLSRKIAWPILGVGTLAGIVGEIMRGGSLDTPMNEPRKDTIDLDDVERAVKVLERPCQELNVLCREAVEHILCTLGLGKYTKPSLFSRLFKKSHPPTTDDEAVRDIGTDAFLARFDAGLDTFKGIRTNNLAQFYDAKQVKPTQGLYLVLSVEFILLAVAQEIRELILFVDNLRVDGSLTRKRIVFPKMKTFRKAFGRIFHSRGAEDVVGKEYGGDEGDVYTKNFTGRAKRTTLFTRGVIVETSIQPATNNQILKFIFAVLLSTGDFFRSEYSQFGFRTACATLAGTIPGFLASSYNFFTEYRGVWITITVILGMSPTTGASIIGLVTRSFGTIIGGLLAMGVWYMVVGRVPGVIVFSLVVTAFRKKSLFNADNRLLLFLAGYSTGIKQLVLLTIDSNNSEFFHHVFTHYWIRTRGPSLLFGADPQVSQIGLVSIESTGQQYFPIYELAPFRILVTLIGVFLAFIFTIFPFPVTSKDILRQDVARQFHLLSNMYTLTKARFRVAVLSDGTNESRTLRKLMEKEAFKCIAVQARCTENLLYSSWEPNLLHRFPKETYGELLSSMQSLFELFIIQNDAISRMTGHWLHAILDSLGTDIFESQSHLALSLLNILSGSLSLNTPLPPFLSTPRGVSFRALVQERIPEELSLGHVEENGYAVFSALAVSARLTSRELERCVELVRTLVGEVDLRWDMDEEKKDM